MAERKKKVVRSASLVILGLTVQGRAVPDLNVSYTEWDDGTRETTGLPPLFPKDLSWEHLMELARGVVSEGLFGGKS